MKRLVDLTLTIGPDTPSPPSVDARLRLTPYRRGPGFWQASRVDMLLHTGSHVDFARHCQADGETAADVAPDRVYGDALVIDLTPADANFEISVAALQAAGPDIRPGDIVLVRTDWTERAWGDFPRYYMESPYCAAEAAQWIVDRGAKAVGFDCFSEYSARVPDFTSEDFVIHKTVLDGGAILMQQMTGLSQLPVGERFAFLAAFPKIDGAEGAPARFLAFLD